MDLPVQVLGGYAACHRLLLRGAAEDARPASSSRQLCQLHHLGLLLGVDLWVQDYKDLPQRALRLKQERLQPEGSRLHRGGINPQDSPGPVGNEERSTIPRVSSKVAPSRRGPDEQTKAVVPASAEASSAADGKREVSCRAVVEEIRQEEFGLGDDSDAALGQAGLRLREVQNARMGRALQRLSHELYSRDSHFVLELIQASVF